MTGQENSDRETLVFVYGTLKQGEPNDHVMINPETGKQRFVGVARTLGKFPLIVASKYNRIQGEVYAVDDQKLVALDELEAHPIFYRREEHDVQLDDGSKLRVWIYLMPTWTQQLLDSATEPLESYSCVGSHGRVYVSRYLREQEIERENFNMIFFVRGTGAN
ncbi:gamma-glutamylaminecyclotransferase B-like isoform 1 [Aphelenchoides avenae]|nr:gamma-glutamylaminecyclotransferase B-like isoform 1 [Aphelenchus avenae]